MRSLRRKLPLAASTDVCTSAGVIKCPKARLWPPADSLSAVNSRPFDKGVPGKPGSGGVGVMTALCQDMSVPSSLVSLESSTLLYVRTRVGDDEVDALVDSGASFNFVSSALVRKLGWECLEDKEVIVRLADGSTISS